MRKVETSRIDGGIKPGRACLDAAGVSRGDIGVGGGGADERQQILLCFFDITDRAHCPGLIGSKATPEQAGIYPREDLAFAAAAIVAEAGFIESPLIPFLELKRSAPAIELGSSDSQIAD